MNRGKASWRLLSGIAAQVTASCATVMLTVAAARGLSAKDFGFLALALSLVALGVGVVRGWCAEPLVFRERQARARPPRDSAVAALSATVLLGLLVAAVGSPLIWLLT